MINTQTVAVQLLSAQKYRYFIYFYLFGGLAAIALITWYTHQGLILVIGSLILSLCPVFFKKGFRKRFIYKACFEFHAEKIVVTTYSHGEETFLDKTEFRYDHLRSYRIFEAEDESYLKLYLQNNTEAAYNFEHADRDGSESTIAIFTKYIKAFNQTIGQSEYIVPKPSFYTTKVGTFILTIIGGGWLILLFFLLSRKPQVLPIAVLGGMWFFLQILTQRKRDIRSYRNQL
jgi:hypothetical protein